MTDSSHKPSSVLTKFYRKKSEKGATYFSGRLGYARVALLKTSETGDDGSEVWNLVVSEPVHKRENGDGQRPREGSGNNERQPVAAAARGPVTARR